MPSNFFQPIQPELTINFRFKTEDERRKIADLYKQLEDARRKIQEPQAEPIDSNSKKAFEEKYRKILELSKEVTNLNYFYAEDLKNIIFVNNHVNAGFLGELAEAIELKIKKGGNSKNKIDKRIIKAKNFLNAFNDLYGITVALVAEQVEKEGTLKSQTKISCGWLLEMMEKVEATSTALQEVLPTEKSKCQEIEKIKQLMKDHWLRIDTEFKQLSTLIKNQEKFRSWYTSRNVKFFGPTDLVNLKLINNDLFDKIYDLLRKYTNRSLLYPSVLDKFEKLMVRFNKLNKFYRLAKLEKTDVEFDILYLNFICELDSFAALRLTVDEVIGILEEVIQLFGNTIKLFQASLGDTLTQGLENNNAEQAEYSISINGMKYIEMDQNVLKEKLDVIELINSALAGLKSLIKDFSNHKFSLDVQEKITSTGFNLKSYAYKAS